MREHGLPNPIRQCLGAFRSPANFGNCTILGVFGEALPSGNGQDYRASVQGVIAMPTPPGDACAFLMNFD
jgi:hypothetical protein